MEVENGHKEPPPKPLKQDYDFLKRMEKDKAEIHKLTGNDEHYYGVLKEYHSNHANEVGAADYDSVLHDLTAVWRAKGGKK